MFRDKVVIVLGASAEGGSGWTIARLLAGQGAKLVVAARRIEGIQKLAQLTDGLAVRCDAAVEEDVQALVAATLGKFGRVDIAIQAAGAPVVGSICETSTADFNLATSINYSSFFYLLKHVGPVITNNGAILVLTSVSATHVSPGFACYGAAKAACQALVRYAAIEFAPRGIRVNALCPGLIETPMTKGLLSNEKMRQAIYKEIPLGRGVAPEQIAASALDLVRPGSAITGQSIIVDNGLSLRRSPYPDEIPTSVFDDNAKSSGY